MSPSAVLCVEEACLAASRVVRYLVATIMMTTTKSIMMMVMVTMKLVMVKVVVMSK
jgi:hypothetical protein